MHNSVKPNTITRKHQPRQLRKHLPNPLRRTSNKLLVSRTIVSAILIHRTTVSTKVISRSAMRLTERQSAVVLPVRDLSAWDFDGLGLC